MRLLEVICIDRMQRLPENSFDHTALDPAVRDLLFEAIGAVIDDAGGSFVMNFETVLVTAIRLA